MSHDDGRKDQGPAAPGSDAERDAWLREALRHAPDASAAPPAALREAILTQARAATAAQAAARMQASRPGSRRPLAEFWAWLARPPVASGFAGLMAAALVGVMWWDPPLDLARPRPASPSAERLERAPGAVATAPSLAETTAPLAETAPPLAETTRPPVAPDARAAEPSTPAAEPPPLRAKKEVDALLRSRQTPDAPRAVPPAESKATADAAQASGAGRAAPATRAPAALGDAGAAPDSAAAAAAPMTAPRAATAPAPAGTAAAPPLPSAPALARDRQGVAAGEIARNADADVLASRAPFSAEAEKRSERADTARRDGGLVAAQEARAGNHAASSLFASVAAERSRWSRQLPDGSTASLDDATRRWLADLDAATRGRWTATASDSSAASNAASPAGAAGSIVLLLDGRPGAVLRLAGSAAAYDSRVDGTVRAWRAPLTETDAARLAATLPH